MRESKNLCMLANTTWYNYIKVATVTRRRTDSTGFIIRALIDASNAQAACLPSEIIQIAGKA